MGDRPEKERAAERVSQALEDGVPEGELDSADAQRVADATSAPQPEPDEGEADVGDPGGA